MDEVVIVEEPDAAPAALEWLTERLAQMDAVVGEAVAGIAGSVDAVMRIYKIPDGSTVEVWSDNYDALSLRGDRSVIDELFAEYHTASSHG